MHSRYLYHVPESKRVRYIVHADCKNEADDQFTLAHILMTPMLEVKGIIGGHFSQINKKRFEDHTTALESVKEIHKILELMGLEGKVPVYHGAEDPLKNESERIDNEAVDFIIQEAMRDDPMPLYIGMQGALTDLAAAIVKEPAICDRMTCIFIGGGNYPEGGWEFNLAGDRHAANIVFSSSMPLWQVPLGTYKKFSVSLAELQAKVYPCGELGRYLFTQMAQLNDEMADRPWPHGETWCLGDEGVIAALLQDKELTSVYFETEAPRIAEDYHYVHNTGSRKIRVYTDMEARLDLEDLFAKLRINFGNI